MQLKELICSSLLELSLYEFEEEVMIVLLFSFGKKEHVVAQA